jgi:adenosylmethionine-8-amino-7-oxononanoate aminotransferase
MESTTGWARVKDLLGERARFVLANVLQMPLPPKARGLVYQKAFAMGLAWIPAGHILRMSPPIVMEDDVLLRGLDIIDEAIGQTQKELMA